MSFISQSGYFHPIIAGKEKVNPRLKTILKEISMLAELRELKRRKAEIEARDRQPESNRSETLTDPARDNH